MQLASISATPPCLVRVIEALAGQAHSQSQAVDLLHELSGITALVAKKFTNDKTAEGIFTAYHLTIGCLSLALSQEDVPDNSELRLQILLNQGAEVVFQKGFRLIKELSTLPYVAFVSDFDRDSFVQQRNLKMLFHEICLADPSGVWKGGEVFRKEHRERQHNQQLIACALWLRKHHYAGPIKDSDLDANAVIAIAIIFGIWGDGRVVARVGQKDIEQLISHARESGVDVEMAWASLLQNIPPQYQSLLRYRMNEYRNTIIRKIYSKCKVRSLVAELQDYYAGSEVDVEYP